MEKHILFTQKARKYQGKYIAVKNGNVVASGKDSKEAFYLAKKILRSRRPDGIYYIPRRKDLFTALLSLLPRSVFPNGSELVSICRA